MDAEPPPESVGGYDRLRRRFERLPVPPYEVLMADRPRPPYLGTAPPLAAGSMGAGFATLAYGDVLDPDGSTAEVVTPLGDETVDGHELLRFTARRWVVAPGPVESEVRTTVEIDGTPHPATILIQEGVAAVVPDGRGQPVVVLQGVAPTGLRLQRCQDLGPYIRGSALAGELLRRRYPDGRGPRRRR